MIDDVVLVAAVGLIFGWLATESVFSDWWRGLGRHTPFSWWWYEKYSCIPCASVEVVAVAGFIARDWTVAAVAWAAIIAISMIAPKRLHSSQPATTSDVVLPPLEKNE